MVLKKEREKCRLSYLIAWSTSTEHWGESSRAMEWGNTLKALEHKFEVIKIEWNKKVEKNQFDGYRGGSMEWNCRRDCIFNDVFFHRQRDRERAFLMLSSFSQRDESRVEMFNTLLSHSQLNLTQFILIHIHTHE